MSKILIKSGRVIDPAQNLDEVTDILIEDDKIVKIGDIEAEKDTNVILAAGRIVMPGAIDLHVHLRDLGQAYKETIETGTLAARKGGVTTVFAMPNTTPQLCSVSAIQQYKDLAKDARVHLEIIGAITKHLEGSELANIEEYTQFGIKHISDDGYDVNDETILRAAYEKAKELNMTVVTHPEMDDVGEGGVMNEGRVSDELGVPGQPNEKESRAVERAIFMARETGAKAHVTHITTAESVQLVRDAKAEGLNVTADVTAHHIMLTEDIILTIGALGKVNPPLRTEQDRLALIEGIKDGTIDCMITDHAPHSEEEKSGDIREAAFGFSEIEVLVPATITELYHNQGMELIDVIELLTSAPAKIGEVAAGTLEEGSIADITIVNLDKAIVVDRHKLVSKGKNCPFHEMSLKGWPEKTIVAGAIYES